MPIEWSPARETDMAILQMEQPSPGGDGMAAPAPSQQDVGRSLRRARQRHHVQLEDAATITRIPKRYLEALEANAPLEAYPAPVYARAFLREYAQYLNIDPEPLVARFGTVPSAEVRLSSIAGDAVPPPRRWPARVLLALSIGGLLGLAAVGILSDRTGVLGPLPPQRPVSSPAMKPANPGPKHVHRFSGITAAMHVIGPCWVRAAADGKMILPGHTYAASQRATFSAKHSLDLTLGNAGGVRLILNGRRVPTGLPGQPIHLAIAFQNGKVHVTRA